MRRGRPAGLNFARYKEIIGDNIAKALEEGKQSKIAPEWTVTVSIVKTLRGSSWKHVLTKSNLPVLLS